jgi:four helix bundle protein
MRDHRKLKAFQLADTLALLVYKETRSFPKSETYGISSQMRRAAVSVAANIAEGSARRTQADFVRFLDIAFSSLREIEYYIHLTKRLGYLTDTAAHGLASLQSKTAQKLAALTESLR